MTEYSTTIKNVAAGLSQTFGEIIKLFFDSNGFDVGNAGISLPFEPEDIRLWAKVGVIIQDGSAHKYVWSSRGDAGSRICLLCKNLVSGTSEMLDADDTNLLRSDIIKLDELEASTDADLRANARYLEQVYGTMSNADFTALQQALGITHQPHSILLDRTLDNILSPTATYHHDWMHALFSDGVFNRCFYLLFEAAIDNGMKDIYEVFHAYVSNWKWPKRLHNDKNKKQQQ